MKKFLKILILILIGFIGTIFLGSFQKCYRDNTSSIKSVKKAIDVPNTTLTQNFYIGSAAAPFEFIGGDTGDGNNFKTTFRDVLTTFNQYYINGIGEITNSYDGFQTLNYNYIDIDVQLPYFDTKSINPLGNRKIRSEDPSFIAIGFYSPSDSSIGGYALYNYEDMEHRFNAGEMSTPQWVSTYRLTFDSTNNFLSIPTNTQLIFTFELINVQPLFESPTGEGYNVISATLNTNYISLNSNELENFINNTNDASYNQGFENGYNNGYDIGYNNGYSEGIESNNNIFDFILTAFNIVSSVLSVEILPNIRLWYIVAVPLVFSVVKFIIGWFR